MPKGAFCCSSIYETLHISLHYRPISLLSCFNRIFEKLISSSQYGFRQGHSTEHAILDIVSASQSNIGASKFSCGVFFDLKKAFDTVDHGILLKKLAHYGFRGLINDWFRSYLLTRAQVTVVRNRSSSKSFITCGVPQGSVLGPLLFPCMSLTYTAAQRN